MAERVLARLNRLNRTGVFLVTALVVFGSLVAGGLIAASVLILLTAVVLAVTAGAWRRLTVGGRAARIGMLALLMLLAAMSVRR